MPLAQPVETLRRNDMDELLGSIGRLFSTFKDPVQVLLLLICFAEGFALYKLASIFITSHQAQIESRLKMAAALEGLKDMIEAKIK